MTPKIVKRVSDEQNVSDRHATYDVYVGNEYVTTFDDILDAADFVKEKYDVEIF